MKAIKFFCIPASKEDNDVLRTQVWLGAKFRKELALIENRARLLLRGIADWPGRDVPVVDRSDWWKSDTGKAASKAWYKSDECKALKKLVHDGKYKAINTALTTAKALRVETYTDENGQEQQRSLLGAMWGTCGKACDAATAAQQAVDKLGLIDEEGQTREVSTDFPPDEGRVAVQFQKGNARICPRTGKAIPAKKAVYADELVGSNDSRLQIGSVAYALGDPVDGFRPAAVDDDGNPIDVWKNGTPKGKRFHALKIRVGTIPGTIRPIWANVHILLKQSPRTKRKLELPHEVVKWAVIKRERTGTRYRWYVHFEVEGESQLVGEHPHPHDSLAIHIGWRQLFSEVTTTDEATGETTTRSIPDRGMRVTYWMADAPLDPTDPNSPTEGQFVVPQDTVLRKQRSDTLRSTRDLNQNTLRDMLHVYIQTLPRGSWLRMATTAMHQWRSPKRYAQLLRRWRDNRIHGDQAAFSALEAWDKQDRHLFDWEAHNITKMKRSIEGSIEQFAVKMAKRYGVIGFDNFRVDKLVVKDDDIAEAPLNEQKLRKKTARRVNMLAPGAARAACKKFCKKYGSNGIEAESAGITIDCAECGHRRDIADVDRAQRELRCENCGCVEDQDRTAARNLLAAVRAIAQGGRGWPSAEPVVVAAPKRKPPKLNRRRGQGSGGSGGSGSSGGAPPNTP